MTVDPIEIFVTGALLGYCAAYFLGKRAERAERKRLWWRS